MSWLSGDPRRPFALRLAIDDALAARTARGGVSWWRERRWVLLRLGIELLVGLAFALLADLSAFGLCIVAALRVGVALRAEPACVRWESSAAAVIALFIGVIVDFGLQSAVLRHDVSGVWFCVPWMMAAYALVTRPAAGLAFVATFVTWPFHRYMPMWTYALPLVTVVLAMRDQRWRLPLTWVLAGIAVQMACKAISFDHEALGQTGMLSPHSAAWVHGVQADLAMLAMMVIAGRALLAERAWAVIAMVITCALYAMQPAPHRVLRWQILNGPIHPLDAGQAHVFAGVAIVLALTWAWPFVRALRAR